MYPRGKQICAMMILPKNYLTFSWNRGKVSENLDASAVLPVSNVVASLIRLVHNVLQFEVTAISEAKCVSFIQKSS